MNIHMVFIRTLFYKMAPAPPLSILFDQGENKRERRAYKSMEPWSIISRLLAPHGSEASFIIFVAVSANLDIFDKPAGLVEKIWAPPAKLISSGRYLSRNSL
jgi:hypothetical protein